MSPILLDQPAPVKLSELEPEWLHFGASFGVGIRFLCPCKKMGLAEHQNQLTVLFLNTLAGAHSVEDNEAIPGNNGGQRWARSGLTFEDLTLSPRIDASHSGCWTGEIIEGVLTFS